MSGKGLNCDKNIIHVQYQHERHHHIDTHSSFHNISKKTNSKWDQIKLIEKYFLNNCFNHPTSIKLIDCASDDIFQKKIVKISNNLYRLDLSYMDYCNIPPEVTRQSNDISSNLTTLILSHNRISVIDKTFKFLKKIVNLDLSYNELYQPKTTSVIGRLKTLKRLYLNNNNLSSIEGLSRLNKLEFLNLESNHIDDMGISFYKSAASLLILYIARNKLTNIDSEIKHFLNVQEIDMSYNNLENVCSELFCLPKIESINLSFNKLSTIPRINKSNNSDNNEKKTQNLKFDCSSNLHVDVSNNAILKFPETLFAISSYIDLSSNFIRVIPTSAVKNLSYKTRKKLIINNNRLVTPPHYITDHGLAVLVQFVKEVKSFLKNYRPRFINIIGTENSGKTNLIQSVVYQQPTVLGLEKGIHTLGVDYFASELPHSLDHVDESNGLSSSNELNIFKNCISLGDNVDSHSIKNSIKQMSTIDYTFSDFSGNESYYYPNLYFLYEGAMSVIIFNPLDLMTVDLYDCIGRYIDMITTKWNRIVCLIIATHMDVLDQYDKNGVIISKKQNIHPKYNNLKPEVVVKIKYKLDQLLTYTNGLMQKFKENIKTRISKIENNDHISTALSEQLKQYISLLKREIHIDKRSPFRWKVNSQESIDDLTSLLISIKNNNQLYPNCLKPVSALWIDIENYIDQYGNGLVIPVLNWDEYSELISSRFGIKSIIHDVTIYLAETGKILWLSYDPHLRNTIFLKPIWLMELIKVLYIENLSELKKIYDESVNSLNLNQKSKEYWYSFIEARHIHVDLLKCLWYRYLKSDITADVIENIVLYVIHELELGFYSNVSNNSRDQFMAKVGTAKLNNYTSNNHRKSLNVFSEISNVENSEFQTTDRPSKFKQSFPSVIKSSYVCIPSLPVYSKEKNVSNANIEKYFSKYYRVGVGINFPWYTPDGLISNIIVRLFNQKFEMTVMNYWQNGCIGKKEGIDLFVRIYTENHKQKKSKSIDIPCAKFSKQTRIRVYYKSESDESIDYTNNPTSTKHTTNAIWSILLPYLKSLEKLFQNNKGAFATTISTTF
ncbi:hypothetical protein A3Q56_06767 [Intoshia linei]|uniref:Roc domain-containing protein n=1 Tax=Intoshia linei TaxID=1819745 RepID=A0A177AU46_9BILA|nr:hypothetical protein A3Q56_06767 [Intoshia linei]